MTKPCNFPGRKLARRLSASQRLASSARGSEPKNSAKYISWWTEMRNLDAAIASSGNRDTFTKKLRA